MKRRTNKLLARARRVVEHQRWLLRWLPVLARYEDLCNTTTRFYGRLLPILEEEERQMQSLYGQVLDMERQHGESDELLEAGAALEHELERMRRFRPLLFELTVLRFGVIAERVLKAALEME